MNSVEVISSKEVKAILSHKPENEAEAFNAIKSILLIDSFEVNHDLNLSFEDSSTLVCELTFGEPIDS